MSPTASVASTPDAIGTALADAESVQQLSDALYEEQGAREGLESATQSEAHSSSALPWDERSQSSSAAAGEPLQLSRQGSAARESDAASIVSSHLPVGVPTASAASAGHSDDAASNGNSQNCASALAEQSASSAAPWAHALPAHDQQAPSSCSQGKSCADSDSAHSRCSRASSANEAAPVDALVVGTCSPHSPSDAHGDVEPDATASAEVTELPLDQDPAVLTRLSDAGSMHSETNPCSAAEEGAAHDGACSADSAPVATRDPAAVSPPARSRNSSCRSPDDSTDASVIETDFSVASTGADVRDSTARTSHTCGASLAAAAPTAGVAALEGTDAAPFDTGPEQGGRESEGAHVAAAGADERRGAAAAGEGRAGMDSPEGISPGTSLRSVSEELVFEEPASVAGGDAAEWRCSGDDVAPPASAVPEAFDAKPEDAILRCARSA